MVNGWWFACLAGSVLGFLSGLGVGGGSLLMLWLTLVVGTDPAQARLMNLMFFLPCALGASIFRFRKAKPDRGLAKANGSNEIILFFPLPMIILNILDQFSSVT